MDERDLSHGLGADISLPPCPTSSGAKDIWNPAHISDPRAEISGEIVWYDALAPRPEVLLSFSCFYVSWLCTHAPCSVIRRTKGRGDLSSPNTLALRPEVLFAGS